MAIRPIKSINELPFTSFKPVFKSFREIGKNQNFLNLFVACLEHFILYTRGTGLKEFIQTVFSMISSEQLESIKELFLDVFEDLEDLIKKKQMKILTSMIYDCNFINFLTNFSEMIEVPVIKSSADENLNEFFYFGDRMRISFVILTPKWKEMRLLSQNALICLYLLADNEQLFILFPLEYKELQLNAFENKKTSEDQEEDMRKINFNSKNSFRSLSEVNPGQRIRNFSPTDNKQQLETRMRLRAQALKQKREQKRQEEAQKKEEQEKLAELEKSENLRKKQQLELQEQEKTKEKARLEEENRILKEWKKSEDEKKQKNQTKLLQDLESSHFPEYLPEELIQVIENFHRTEEEKLLEEKKNLELQKQELENLVNQKNKISEDLKLAEAKMIEEEQKLMQDKTFHEIRKLEIEKTIANERIQLLVKQEEELKWINEEKQKLEVLKIQEEKKLQDELRKIEARRLAEDRKIAEEKRIAAESRLSEMKNLINDFKRRSKTPQLLTSSGNQIENPEIQPEQLKKNEKSLENQIKIQEIIENLQKSEKPKINLKFSEFSPIKTHELLKNLPNEQESLKTLSKDSLTAEKISNKEEFKEKIEPKIPKFNKNCLKFKPKPKPEEKKPEEKQETWLDQQKRLLEIRKLEVEKILENTKKLEFKRNSDRRKTEEKSVLEESKRLLEGKKRQRSGRFTSLDNSIQDLSPIDKKIKPAQSVLGGGIFDEIFSKSMSRSSDQFDDQLEEIRGLSSNLKDLNFSEALFSSPESIIKLEPVIMTNISPFSEDPEVQNSSKPLKTPSKPAPHSSEATCDNKSICGGLLCPKCSKDLKKSSFFLQCQTCCPAFLNNSPQTSSKLIQPTKKQTCLKCSQKFSKGEELWCFCCFLQLKVFKKAFTACESCQKPGFLFWVDSSSGENLKICTFCGEGRTPSSLLEICGKCSELVCFICLRKNPYVASGICSTCHGRRQVKVYDFNNNPNCA